MRLSQEEVRELLRLSLVTPQEWAELFSDPTHSDEYRLTLIMAYLRHASKEQMDRLFHVICEHGFALKLAGLARQIAWLLVR